MKSLFFLILFCFFSIAYADSNLIYFTQYSENKNAFLQLSQKINSADWKTETSQWSLHQDPNLTTDLLFLKKTKPAQNLLILSSGLHGIEGYVGSAIQRWFVETHLKNNPISYDVLLIHSLNPWGMQNKRRVNEHNIDLNRNFMTDESGYKVENQSYMSIDSFLNPQSSVDLHIFSKVSFFYDSIKLILQNSIDTLRKSILIGQYQQPRGLFYGGTQAASLKGKIDELIKKQLSNYQKTIWVDLHTGYGENGKLHFLSNDSKSENGLRLTSSFPNTKIDFGEEKKFYKTSGDLTGYVASKSQNQNTITSVVFEYGTLDSQSTLGSIESLRRMVLENQGYQNKFANEESRAQTTQLFKDMFCPESPEWQAKILQQTEGVFKNVVFH